MIINEKNTTELSGFYFVYKGSTNLERPGWYGLAHLMEHLVCKTFDDIQDDLDENGVSWNAYTSLNIVVFHFIGLEEYLAPYRDILVERLKTFDVTPEEVENEKRIVIEEYLDSFTDQYSIFSLNYMRKQYNSYGPIGLKQDIENITYQDCLDFFEEQYKYPDMIINISKDFEYYNDDLKFKDRSGLLKSDWKQNLDAPLELRNDFPDKTILLYDKVVDADDSGVLSILNSMLCNGLQSPLYQEIREKRALAYYVSCHKSKLGTQNMLRILTMTSPDKVDQVEEAINLVFNNKEEYLTPKRLETVRKFHLISKKKSLINRHKNISDIIDPSVLETYKIIENVTLDEVYEVFDKYYNLSSFLKITDKNY
jgi:predicted Zn-dependent peptidase